MDFEENDDKPSSKQEINKIIVQRNNFVKMKKENHLKNYIHIKDIGSGSFGTVSKIKMKYTGFIRAAKTIQYSAISKMTNKKEKVINEITIPMKLDHPNINKLY